MIYQPHGTFRLITLGDKGAIVQDPGVDNIWPSSFAKERLGIDYNSLGAASGLLHFLVALFWLMETSWNKRWNDTLDSVDEILTFNASSCHPSTYIMSY